MGIKYIMIKYIMIKRYTFADADADVKADAQKPFFGHYSTANMIIA